jgi:hypothetical protein
VHGKANATINDKNAFIETITQEKRQLEDTNKEKDKTIGDL